MSAPQVDRVHYTQAWWMHEHGNHMSSKGTPGHTVRVPDDIWSRAKAVADEVGDTLGNVVRCALEDYAERRDELVANLAPPLTGAEQAQLETAQ